MKFSDIVDQARALLQRTGKVTYRVLRREFALDDEALEDLKDQFIHAEEVAVDQDGKMLVWKGAAADQERGQKSSGESEPKPTPSEADSGTDKPRDPRPPESERRQLTVMFIDLVGSTTLSHQLDPEDYHARVVAYQTACHRVIEQYEGHIAQYLGDGVLAYFGYPAAHEDDAVHAVRSGLEIVAAVHQLAYTPPLQVRIGIHTGPVVVGEIGGGERRETLALGETPNLAARVQGAAAPNTVVLSAATARLVEGLFERQDLGPHTLKGISASMSLYRVVRDSGAQSRFEAAVQKGLTPLVGREHEVGLLEERWERATAREGQVVLLSGEAGIGKSRLVQVLKERIAAAHARVECRCSPYYQNSALYPVIKDLQRLLQFAREDSAEQRLHKLEKALESAGLALPEVVPLVASLLSLSLPAYYPSLPLTPQRQRQKTLEALLAWLLKEEEQRPLLVVIEDLHWVDPSTLEFLSLLIDQVPPARILMLLTFRPDFHPPWAMLAHLTQVTLSRFDRKQVEVMVERVTGGRSLPAEVFQQIVRKTDGVPLFVEELTKMVIESGLVRESNGHYELTGPLPPLAIPSTLQDSLMARLDRLSEARQVAQLGALLGREFSYELLQAVAPLSDTELQSALAKLVEAEILYQRGSGEQARYVFKHALIQDTAYHSLLKSMRQQYHQQIARILEDHFLETKETQPEIVAHHYTEAGLLAQALPFWQQAGQRASERSANVEAVGHLTKALELLQTLPDTLARTQQELTLHVSLGHVQRALKGQAAPEVEQTYARALALCQQLGETPQLFPVLAGLRRFYVGRGNLEAGRVLGEQLLGLAQRMQHSAFLVEAHYSLGNVLFWQGEFVAADAHMEQGMACFHPQQSYSPAASSRPDIEAAVGCYSFAAFVQWFLGYPNRALKKSAEALALARNLSRPHNMAQALSFATLLHVCRREGRVVQEHGEGLITLCTEHGFPFWLAGGHILRGWAIGEQGQGAQGVAEIREGMAAKRATGAELEQTLFHALLAEAYGKAGQVEDGLTTLAEALTVVDKSGERFYETELYRLKGELTLQSKVQDPTSTVAAEAEECFLKAIEIARKQQAKSLELRAVMSLSRLWQQQGKKDEARQMLAEIYGWFTEGFDTKDLQEAKALLTALEESC